MITPQEAAAAAEKAITQYAGECETNSPDDIRKALEMLISKAARGIEKYSGNPIALDVLVRTLERISIAPATQGGKPS